MQVQVEKFPSHDERKSHSLGLVHHSSAQKICQESVINTRVVESAEDQQRKSESSNGEMDFQIEHPFYKYCILPSHMIFPIHLFKMEAIMQSFTMDFRNG